MVDQIRLASFTLASGAAIGDPLDITDAGITETCRAAIILAAATTTEDSRVTPGRMCMGLMGTETLGTQGVCMAPMVRNGLTTPDNRTGGGGGGPTIALNDNTATGTNFVARLSADNVAPAIAGGVRLEVTSAITTADVHGKALLFAGNNMRVDVRAITVTTTLASTVTNGNSAGADFVPDLLVVLHGDQLVTTTPGAVDDAVASIGFVVNDGAASQLCSFVNIDDATEPTDADGRLDTTHGAAGLQTGARGTLTTITFAFTANGYSYQASNDNLVVLVLAIKFGGQVRIKAAHEAVSGSAGLQSFNSFGFTPDVVLGMASLLTATDSTTDGSTASCAGWFLTGRYGSWGASIHAQEGVSFPADIATSNAGLIQGESAVYLLEHTGSVAMQASWVGHTGSGGFALDFSTATAGYLTALGIQLIPNPPLPARRPARQRRARARIQRRQPVIGGKPVGAQPLGVRFWRAITRMRRAAQARLRWRPPIFGATPEVGELVDGSSGTVSGPGMYAGTIAGPEFDGAISSTGTSFGTITGPGVLPDDFT